MQNFVRWTICAAALALPVMARADQVVVADFENGTSGFEGAITQDKSVAKEGNASGKVAADLENVTARAWVSLKKPLDLRNEIKAVSFWVKSSEAKQLTVRIDDSTNQVLQQRPAVNPNGEWQKITIPTFESGPGFQSWGGANDKKVHWPAKAFYIIVEKNGLQGGKGTVWLDQVEFETVGAPKSLTPTLEETTQGAQKILLADFENDMSGFTGQIGRETALGKDSKAAAKMEADFSNVERSAWITATKPLDVKNEIKALSFWVKSNEAKQLTVRLLDSTKQTFQLRPTFTPNGQWQQVAITNFEAGPGFQSYGGAGDKKVHWPAASLSFILEKNGLEGGKGTLLIDNVELFVNPDRLVGKLDVGQERIGNVFF